MRASPWILSAVAFASCGKLEVRSTYNGLPATLLGEWQGSWASSQNTTSGQMRVQVQQFQGEPVVDLAIDNPCLVPRSYALAISGAGIDLSADGVVVFHADLPQPGTMRGFYTCAADEGEWQAEWHGALPEILDLSGAWSGSAVHAPGIAEALVLDLGQDVSGGALRLSGTLRLPGLLPVALPVAGVVRFREGQFDVLLQTTSGVVPVVRMAGVGDSPTLSITDGLMQSDAGSLLPFATAVWAAAPESR